MKMVIQMFWRIPPPILWLLLLALMALPISLGIWLISLIFKAGWALKTVIGYTEAALLFMGLKAVSDNRRRTE